MLPIIIIITIPDSSSYKSTLLWSAHQVLHYLVPDYLLNIISNTSASAKYLQFALTVISVTFHTFVLTVPSI